MRRSPTWVLTIAAACLLAAGAHGLTHVANCTEHGVTALVQAQQWVRALPRPLNDSVVVRVAGVCNFAASTGLTFDLAQDCGDSESHAVRWVGIDDATFVGGHSLPAAGWSGVSEAEWLHISGAPLPSPSPNATLLRFTFNASQGVEFGAFQNGGLGYCAQSRAELFINGMPMTIARFPNVPIEQGVPWMDWLHIGSTTTARESADANHGVAHHLRTPESPTTGTPRASRQLDKGRMDSGSDDLFVTRESLDKARYSIWAQTSAAAWSMAWLHGFWVFDWADNYVRVKNVSMVSRGRAQFALDPSTPPVYGLANRARFYLVNLAAELDAVGEYWIDEATNTVFFLAGPDWDPRRSAAHLSASLTPFITISNVHDISFEGIAMLYARGTAVVVDGSSYHVKLDNLTVSSVGLSALSVDLSPPPTTAATRNASVSITRLVSQYAGCRAVALSGGDTTTLASSMIVLDHSDVSRYARWIRTYNPAVAFQGVGITVRRSRIAHAPHNGLLGGGNNHLFADNLLEDLCFEVRDSGAFYIGRSWVNRGMVLAGNTFRRIRALEHTELGADSVQAMYFDDQQSGVAAMNNVCDDVTACFMVGGGRDNTVANTTCINVSTSCILFDNRGMNWQLAMCTNSTTAGPGMLVQQLMDVHYTQPPYSVEYPGLSTTMQQWPCVPVGNHFVGNRCCGAGCPQGVINQGNATIVAWHSVDQDNVNGGAC